MCPRLLLDMQHVSALVPGAWTRISFWFVDDRAAYAHVSAGFRLLSSTVKASVEQDADFVEQN